MSESQFILASQSERRHNLLILLGFHFDIIPSDFDESSIVLDDPKELVVELAKAKARAIVQTHQGSPILAADTLVYFEDTTIGKPVDREVAYDTIKKLQGKTHYVYTGVALVRTDGEIKTDLAATKMTFKAMTEEEIETYLHTNQWQGKAGAYQIQQHMRQFLDSHKGSLSNVIGLPLQETVALLKEASIVPTINWQQVEEEL